MDSSASSGKLSAAAVTSDRNFALSLRHAKCRLALRTAEKLMCLSLLKIQLSALEKSDKRHVFHLSFGKIARHNAEISVNKNKDSQIIHNHVCHLIGNPPARKHSDNRCPNQRIGQGIKSVSACHKCHEPVLHEISPQKRVSILFLLYHTVSVQKATNPHVFVNNL